MQQFPVEDDLVELIWQLAKPQPFEQLSFSDALRRVINFQLKDLSNTSQRAGAKKNQVPSANELLEELSTFNKADSRKRDPKADLIELVRLGALRKGQELFLVDYQRNILDQYKATISGANLLFKGKIHSMSALARDLLKKEGFSSDAVSGPGHWATSNGIRVSDLWKKVLTDRSK